MRALFAPEEEKAEREGNMQTYVAGNGACAKQITRRQSLARAGKVRQLLERRPVQLVEVALAEQERLPIT